MKRQIPILLILFCTHCALAQVSFQKLYGLSGTDETNRIITTTDGGYATIGFTGSGGSGGVDILLTKFDSVGTVLWSNAYGTAKDDIGTGLLQLNNGDFILGGYSYGLSSDSVYDDLLVIRTDSLGNKIWAKAIGGDDRDEANAIILSGDTNIVLCGLTSSTWQTSAQAGYCVKLNLNGSLVWAKSFSQNSQQYFTSVCNASDGGYIFTGSTPTGGTINDYYIVKTDVSGVIQWSKRVGDIATDDLAYSVIESKNTDIIVAGETKISTNTEAALLKLDSAGNILWWNSYGTSDYDHASAVIETISDSLVVIGYSNFGTGTSNFQAFALQLTSDGSTILWQNNFGTSQGNSIMQSVAPCNDEGYILSGWTDSFNSSSENMYTIKLLPSGSSGCYETSGGYLVNSLTASDSSGSSSISGSSVTDVTNDIAVSQLFLIEILNCLSTPVKEISPETGFNVYPSLFTDQLNVTVTNLVEQKSALTLQSADGKKVFSKEIISGEENITINTKNITSGIYTLTLLNDRGTNSKKLVCVNPH